MLPTLSALSELSLVGKSELVVLRGEPVTQEELEKRFNNADALDKTARGASGEIRKIKASLDGVSVWIAIKKQPANDEAQNEITQHAAVYKALNTSQCTSLFTEPLEVEPAGDRSPWVYSIQKWACTENTTVILLSAVLGKRPTALGRIGEALKHLGRAWACLHAAGYVHTDSHANNVMLCTLDGQLQSIKLVDMARVREKKEGDGFELEWNEINNSLLLRLAGSLRAMPKFEIWEKDKSLN